MMNVPVREEIPPATSKTKEMSSQALRTMIHLSTKKQKNPETQDLLRIG